MHDGTKAYAFIKQKVNIKHVCGENTYEGKKIRKALSKPSTVHHLSYNSMVLWLWFNDYLKVCHQDSSTCNVRTSIRCNKIFNFYFYFYLYTWYTGWHYSSYNPGITHLPTEPHPKDCWMTHFKILSISQKLSASNVLYWGTY